MLVYGDPWRTLDIAQWRERVATPLAGSSIARHDELTGRLIELGQLLQALADRAFENTGERDRDGPELLPLKRHLSDLARALLASFDGRPTQTAFEIPDLPHGAPASVRAREPEGYAFYALYPEAYALAARRLGARPDALVIGLRSIGASLAPMVAAGVGAASFTTLRPKGPPFRREIDAPDLAAALRRRPPEDVLVVDEGPGLSGSSFASVAGFVHRHAPGSRVVLFPSHGGAPGAQADAQTRRLFATAPRQFFCFAEILRARLPDWVADFTGPPLAPLEDLSGGGWRRYRYDDEAHWPAVDAMQERLKFLLRAQHGLFLLKFVGLGDVGRRKAEMARALGDAKLATETLGIRHGFTVERWRDDARPLDLARDRAMLVPALARYLAFRRRHFTRPDACGASPDDLVAMVARNVALALGEAAAATARGRLAPLRGCALTRIATDNRMQAHGWLVARDGALLKTDAVDHHAGHDLIGAQDISFDVAGAAVELALTPAETAELRQRVENETGQMIAAELVEAMRIVCLAFEIGRAEIARYGCAAGPDAQRLVTRRDLLTESLRRALAERRSSPDRELQSHTLVWPT